MEKDAFNLYRSSRAEEVYTVFLDKCKTSGTQVGKSKSLMFAMRKLVKNMYHVAGENQLIVPSNTVRPEWVIYLSRVSSIADKALHHVANEFGTEAGVITKTKMRDYVCKGDKRLKVDRGGV